MVSQTELSIYQEGASWVVLMTCGSERKTFVCATEKMAQQFYWMLGRAKPPQLTPPPTGAPVPPIRGFK